jgi:hypothetical protein
VSISVREASSTRSPIRRRFPRRWLTEIAKHERLLRGKWDEMYPENPIESKEDDDD